MKIKKIYPFCFLIAFALSFVCSYEQMEVKGNMKTYHVDFFSNYLREDFTLSSGYKGKGNNLLYKTIEVNANEKITKPDDPKRQYYEFLGWYKETTCENVWNFENDVVKNNLRLYAKWEYSSEVKDVEPDYYPPSTVLEEDAQNDYEIYSIMAFKIDSMDNIHMSRSAISRLKMHKNNILHLMQYKVKNSKQLTAKYIENESNDFIEIKCGSEIRIIHVIPEAYRIVSNQDYENKAIKYEENIKNEDENFHVMLAGSSSIEFWETSKEDMDPIITYNHGIGGTTVEDWINNLNQRLVYPYNPKMVVYYVGINNLINAGKTSSQTFSALKKLFDNTHEALPNAKIQYILLNLVPGFPSQYDNIKEVNASVKAYQKNNSNWLTLINAGDALLKQNGEPNAAYFRTDGLHLTYAGYSIWGQVIKESVIQGLRNK